jgi:hypothetical protein
MLFDLRRVTCKYRCLREITWDSAEVVGGANTRKMSIKRVDSFAGHNDPPVERHRCDNAHGGLVLEVQTSAASKGAIGMTASITPTVGNIALQGHYIPEGTIVVANIYPTHRMEPWWNEPDTFDPERFNDERREDKSHRMAWAPFGKGAHKCLGMYFAGMEIKAIMHQMLLGFRWSVDPDYSPPISFGTGPFPADGLPIKLMSAD